jgi:hypothetical protein
MVGRDAQAQKTAHFMLVDLSFSFLNGVDPV